MAGGRPTDYNEEVRDNALAYLQECVKGNELPQVAALALYLKTSRSNLYLWKGLYPEFSDILDDILASQEKALINKGLDGSYNSTITKLILAKHGYRESSDVTSDGKPIPIIPLK